MFLCKKTPFNLSIFLILFTLLSPWQFIYANRVATGSTINIKILGINDFHGHISSGELLNEQPVGGAAVLAAYLKKAQAEVDGRVILTIMGDLVGASPPSSGLLQDEPSILFINSLGNKYCSTKNRKNPLCNIVATLGNHEFDKGQKAMRDLIYGTDRPPADHWIDLPHYPGATYPYISANIIDATTEKPLFPPYIIKLVDGIPIAFIGAVLKNAPDSMFPENAKGITFLDEATSINRYIPEIKAKGAQIIIVIIHEGGNQAHYEGPTRNNTKVEGSIKEIINKLDDEVDVVMGGHTHQFLNAFLPNHHGVNILVTQANSFSTSFAEVTLQVDRITHQLIHKSAQIITTYADRWPGTTPDEQTRELVQLAENKVAATVNAYVGTTEDNLSRTPNNDGESNLGNFIADAYRIKMNDDIGITNLHGIRSNLQRGSVTWGALYSVLPFSNHLVSISLTGKDIYDLLEQQWTGAYPNILQISGIRYTYDPRQPPGHKIILVQHQDHPLILEKTYTIATTNYLASGNGFFSVMKRGTIIKRGASDLETVIAYIRQLPQPFTSLIDGRIKKEFEALRD